jgi:carboxypeptidase Q
MVGRTRFLAFLFFFYLSLSPFIFSQEQARVLPYQDVAEKIIKMGLSEENAYGLLEELASKIGPRLTASPQAAAAVELMRQKMRDLEFNGVHLEPILVNRWVRGKEEAKIVNSESQGTRPLSICALGGSVSTLEFGITAPVLEVKSFEELRSLGDKAKGKIIFFNRPMDRSFVETFRAYGGAAEQRSQGAVEAAKQGAVAVLVRSMTLRVDDYPHTGLMHYDPQVPRIPAAAVSTQGANLLSQLLQKEPSLRVNLKLTCQNLSPVSSANVVGQITGTEFPDEIILLGGHLDSWDLGAGAHDDGAGCVQAVEALRLIKGLGLNPKRTIRAVLFMDEEFGGTGGRFYAKAPERKGEKHLAAFESDRGGFLPLWLGVSGGPAILKKFKAWEYLFKPMQIFGLLVGGSGVDIAPLAEQGTILLGLIPDSQRYFDVHHSARDTLASVNPRELELGAIAMAIMAYVLSQEGL